MALLLDVYWVRQMIMKYSKDYLDEKSNFGNENKNDNNNNIIFVKN